MSITIKRRDSIDNLEPFDNDYVKVKDCNRTLSLIWTQHRNNDCQIQRIDKDTYFDKRSGEVKQINHIETRKDDLDSVRKSLARLRDYINTNVEDVNCCRWVTLTYAENMTDPIKLKHDFKNFNTRCRKVFGNYEYITAAEPQGRGAWHLHVIMIYPNEAPYMENKQVAKLWKHGFVTVKKLKDVDNVGCYLMAYLGDMEVSQAESIGINDTDYSVKQVLVDDNGTPVPKAILKGARLKLYPPNFNLYRVSKGIKKPDIFYTTEEKAKKKVSAGTLTSEKTLILSGDIKNVINYRNYNMITQLHQD